MTTPDFIEAFPIGLDEGHGDLAGQIERQIERRARGRIHGLRVACGDGLVILQGHCRTYHAKQLAQEAALDLAAGRTRLVNQIVVC
ncbi:MAG TPA: phospholipid-binding protein [Isosphaeraceae bacterium]